MSNTSGEDSTIYQHCLMNPETPATHHYSSHHGPPVSGPMLSHSVLASQKVL